jgi:hypothetical protein
LFALDGVVSSSKKRIQSAAEASMPTLRAVDAPGVGTLYIASAFSDLPRIEAASEQPCNWRYDQLCSLAYTRRVLGTVVTAMLRAASSLAAPSSTARFTPHVLSKLRCRLLYRPTRMHVTFSSNRLRYRSSAMDAKRSSLKAEVRTRTRSQSRRSVSATAATSVCASASRATRQNSH